MVPIGIQLNRNVRRILADHNRVGCRRILGAHGGCAVKNGGGKANQNEDQGRHT